MIIASNKQPSAFGSYHSDIKTTSNNSAPKDRKTDSHTNDDYKVSISEQAYKLHKNNERQEDSMSMIISNDIAHNSTSVCRASYSLANQGTFVQVLEEATGETSDTPNSKPDTGQDAAENDNDKSWMPGFLNTETLLRPPYITRIYHEGRVYGTPLNESFSESIEIDPCPAWFSNLARVGIDVDDDETKALVKEYYGYLKEAMEKATEEEKITQDTFSCYTNLILNQDKSKAVHQNVRQKLADDPRSSELMSILGIV